MILIILAASQLDVRLWHRPAHYADAFALSDELEDEAISAYLDRFSAKDCLFTNPKHFLTEMPKAFDSNLEILLPLFRDRFDIAFKKIERQLKAFYASTDTTEAEDIRLTFVIGGTLNTLRELKFEKHYDNEVLAQNVSELISKL